MNVRSVPGAAWWRGWTWMVGCGVLPLAVAMLSPVLSLATRPTPARADDGGEFAREASWRIPPLEDIRDRTLAWLGDSEASLAADAARQARRLWGVATPPRDVLDAVMETIALVDPRAAALWNDPAGQAAAAATWLDDPSLAAFERDAVSLWLGRHLVRMRRFDEARPLLAGLDVATSVDPAGLLFHRAACEHWLLDTEGAIGSLDRLLEQGDAIPVRYARLARLLREDIAELDEASLDHIARRMRDISRRLDLGRAGPSTRKVQDGVIESLDQLIERIEQQQQGQEGQGGAGAGGGGGGGAVKPMDDSRIAGGRGAGEVKSRELGGDDAWGALPPHAREEALQQIGREFPPHYREVIERYFKRLAAGAEDR
jgi:hypothetical protein